jgi:hypothetical protein
VISEYVERLARELDFDPSLSRRVRCEVEDHLWEAVDSSPMADRLEAERRAVANFGDPRAIASQFAVVSLAQQARRVGVAAVLLIGAVFIAMKARLTWYGVMECPLIEELRALSQIVGSIDRYTFWLSVAAAIAGWIYIDSRGTPAAFTREYRGQLGRFSVLCSAATGALIISVIGDAVLTSLRLIGTQWSAVFLVPIFSMAIEIACAGVLVSYIRGIARRAAATARTAS